MTHPVADRGEIADEAEQGMYLEGRPSRRAVALG
jgi:hypothetical protein